MYVTPSCTSYKNAILKMFLIKIAEQAFLNQSEPGLYALYPYPFFPFLWRNKIKKNISILS